MRIICYTITAEIGTERRRARGSGYFAARTGAQHFKHAAAAGAFRLCGGRLRAGQPDGARAPRLGRVHLRPPRGDQSGVSREMSFGAGHTPRHRNGAAGAHAL